MASRADRFAPGAASVFQAREGGGTASGRRALAVSHLMQMYQLSQPTHVASSHVAEGSAFRPRRVVRLCRAQSRRAVGTTSVFAELSLAELSGPRPRQLLLGVES